MYLFDYTKAGVTGNVGYRQVQLEQGIVHCVVLLEDWLPPSLAMPDLSDCDQS